MIKELDINPKDRIYFVHIPKTGGTSFRDIVANFLPTFKLYRDINELEFGLTTEHKTEIENAAVLYGHKYYELVRAYPGAITFTFLRNPISRSVSQFNQFRKEDSTYTSLSEMITGKPGRFSSLQTLFVGAHFVNSSSPFTIEDSFIFGNWEFINQVEVTLENAKINLAEMNSFGIMERYEDSMSLIAFKFGWRPFKKVPRENVSGGKSLRVEDISKDEYSALSTLCQDDIALYDYGVELFEENFTEMKQKLFEYYGSQHNINSVEQLDDENLRFALLETHYEQRFAKRNRENVTEIILDLTETKKIRPQRIAYESFNWRGWHAPGKRGRWTGPENEASIDLPLKTLEPLKIEINVLRGINKDVLANFRFLVNGQLMKETKYVQEKKWGRIYEYIIDPIMLATEKPFTRFTFETDLTLPPKEVNDKRKLGLMVASIKIQKYQPEQVDINEAQGK
ncbi:MAG: sulfotransferase family 2 domain-containing protein [Chloroflexota bacterium]